MNTPRITPASSAEVIPFPTSGKRTGFAKAKEGWLRRAHKEAPAHSIRTFCTALFLNFNFEHYQRTGGELIAWPSWGSLTAKFGLSEKSIREAIAWLEQNGLIRVQRGQRDGQRRAVNKYFALLNPAIPRVENEPQPVLRELSQPGARTVDSKNKYRLEDKSRLDESDSSRLDSKESSRTPEQAAPQPEAGKAANGSSDSVALSSLKRSPPPDVPRGPPSPVSGAVSEDAAAAEWARMSPDERAAARRRVAEMNRRWRQPVAPNGGGQ